MSIFERIRIRRERLADALWDGWDLVLDSVGSRWERMTDAIRARRDRLTDALWDGWERSLDSVGARWERLRGGYRTRREKPSKARARPFRQSVAQRSSIIVGAAVCFVLIVATVSLIHARVAPTAPSDAASGTPPPAGRGIEVPNVRGMPASDARVELERVGLTFAEPRAILGTPGLVLRTEPNIGRPVPPGTPVTIVIGVEAERLGPANS
jgi:PASTA domain